MSEHLSSEFLAQESRKASYKERVSSQIRELLDNGTSLEDVVEALGAEAFYGVGGSRNKQRDSIKHFDVKAFMDYQIESGNFLKLPSKVIKLDKVILPSGEGELKTGAGAGFEKKALWPRNGTLVELLSELDLDYELIEGVLSPNMVRANGYNIYNITDIRKAVFVNDEAENATYIIYLKDGQEYSEFINLTKSELSSFPENNVKKIRFRDIPQWKEMVKDALQLKSPIVKPVEQKPIENQNLEFAPPDWLTTASIADRAGVTSWTVSKLIGKFKAEGISDDWIKTFKNPTNSRAFEYFHPDFVAKLVERLLPIEEAPKGWVTKTGIQSETGMALHTVEKIVKPYRENNPEWFNDYLIPKIKRVEEFLHPDLVKTLINQHKNRKYAPEGWRTVSQLADQLDIQNHERFRNMAKRLASDNPEWIQNYYGKNNQTHDYYHPDLVAKIIAEVNSYERPPEGWKSRADLAKQFKGRESALQAIANKYRSTNPEYFKNYANTNNFCQSFLPQLW